VKLLILGSSIANCTKFKEKFVMIRPTDIENPFQAYADRIS
jgi:hypothetical protein